MSVRRTLRGAGLALVLAWLLGVGAVTQAYAQIMLRSTASASVTGTSPNAVYFGAGAAVSATSGNLTPVLPSGWQPGHVFICVIESRDNVAATMPAGWTLLNQGSGTGSVHRATLFWKRAALGDTNPTVTHASGGRIIARIYGFNYVDMTTPFDVANSFTSSAADSNTEAAAITTTNTDTLLFFVAQIGTTNTATAVPTGSTPWTSAGGASNGTSGDGVSIAAYYGARTTSGVKPALVFTHSNSAQSHGAQFAMRPQTTLTISKPASTALNDVMIASIASKSNSATFTAPAGWTLVRRMQSPVDGSVGTALAVYVKTAGASEPAQYTWTMSTTQGVIGGIRSFYGVDPTTPIDLENGQTTGSGLSHATPSITTTVANAVMVSSHAVDNSATWTPPAGMSETLDIASNAPGDSAGVSIEGNHVLQAVAGASGTKSATASISASHGNAHLLALRPAPATAATVYYVYTDHLNTPRAITNAAVTTVWKWDNNDPFGNNAANEDPDNDSTLFLYNVRFPGQYFDQETNLHYNYYRDYDPSIGRYVQSDPVGVLGLAERYGIVDTRPQSALPIDPSEIALLDDETVNAIRRLTAPRPSLLSDYNLYAYASGNPLTNSDPFGLFPSDSSFGFDPSCGFRDICKALSKNWRTYVFYLLCLASDRRPPPPPPKPTRPPMSIPSTPKAPPTPPQPPAPKPPASG